MKILLGLALVILAHGAGQAPTAPMAPGVVHPGAKNADNQDVPHQGDAMVAVAEDDSVLIFVVRDSQRDEDDGSKSIIVVIVAVDGVPNHAGAHRLAGRARFKCTENENRTMAGYILDDDGNIIDKKDGQPNWKPTKEGSVAELIANIVCHKEQPAPKYHEPLPEATEI
jgi:hypothetical protein